MLYVIFSFVAFRDMESFHDTWSESNYQSAVNDDVADVIGYYHSEAEAVKAWREYYSGSRFDAYCGQIVCEFYALAKTDGEVSEILEISCGSLTADEAENMMVNYL